jgi:hypothetical protein
MNAAVIAEKPRQRRAKRGGGYMGSGKTQTALYGAPIGFSEKVPAEDARQTARLTVEQLADGFGTRGRVMPMTEVLRRRGTLSERQSRAGARVYEAWAFGICGARDADASGGGTSDPGGYRDRQIDAATEYRKAREAVGGRMWPVLFAVVCEEWSIERFANERGRGTDKRGWTAILKLSLDTLADHWGM